MTGGAIMEKGGGAAPAPAAGKQEVARLPNSSNDFRSYGGSDSPDFNNVLLNDVLGTMWLPNRDGDEKSRRIRAGMAALKAFKPADAIEGMLAAQAVALHHAAMECFRRAMHPEQPSAIASKLRKDGANLARGMTDMLEALDRKRGKGPQVVRVERVVVHDGGQAIVGAVSAGAGVSGGGSDDR